MEFILGSSSLVSSPSSSSLLLCSHRKLTRKKMKSSGLMASFNSDRTREEESSSSFRRSFLFLGISALPFLHLRAIAAEDPGKETAVESQASRLATIFLSPRNRKKNLNLKTFELPQAPTSEEKKDTRKQDEQEPEVIMSRKKDTEKQEMSSPKLIQSEQVPVQEVRGSPFVSLFNVLGIIAAGVLGALYATSQKEKAAMETTIESVNNLRTWNTDSLSWFLLAFNDVDYLS